MAKILIGVLFSAAIVFGYLSYSRSQKFAAEWLSESDSFMDMRFGENVKDKLPRCAGSFQIGDPPCWKDLGDDVVNIQNVFIAEYSLAHITVRQPGGRLEQVMIEFTSGRYPGMLDILTKRYGKPTESLRAPLDEIVPAFKNLG
jgi:hypothetical protein